VYYPGWNEFREVHSKKIQQIHNKKKSHPAVDANADVHESGAQPGKPTFQFLAHRWRHDVLNIGRDGALSGNFGGVSSYAYVLVLVPKT
jgi:hypothetical protein